jgi:hypothetical protein
MNHRTHKTQSNRIVTERNNKSKNILSQPSSSLDNDTDNKRNIKSVMDERKSGKPLLSASTVKNSSQPADPPKVSSKSAVTENFSSQSAAPRMSSSQSAATRVLSSQSAAPRMLPSQSAAPRMSSSQSAASKMSSSQSAVPARSALQSQRASSVDRSYEDEREDSISRSPSSR